MALITPSPGRERYIVRSDDARQIAEFINDVNRDPSMKLLNTIGPAGQPHTVVVEMSHDQAASFAERFRASKTPLTIEPDRPLSLFDNL